MKKFFLLSMALLSIGFISCDDDHDDENESELITTLVYTMAPSTGVPVIMTFKDIDGDGGKAPAITTSGSLKSTETYNGSLVLLNESVNPAGDITQEIIAEDEAHQFFFEVSGALAGKVAITYEDKDSENNPIGLKTKVKPSGIGTGKLKITLRHEPNKKAAGVATGSIANAGGETDLEVSFDVEVK
ncbi:MAG: hypothetical protein IPJ13_04955 [Saprospiraceae bacterium]|jgi:hypothetical protein|nr:hypothetical protein [Saprospiraceae bacterium]MBK9567707.1 hypothetical protein [Saprospiraceae bacterium]MBP6445453.1 type 1 periplasmic binding fold superfamily protein [Saprospiraceae bacterium]